MVSKTGIAWKSESRRRVFVYGGFFALDHVRQAGAAEIVSALHQYAPGEVWPQKAVAERKRLIENTPAGRVPLKWTVVESIPVPDDIQREGAGAKRSIEAWVESMRAVATEGIRTICYNVMPVVDWTRTDLDYPMPTGATALRFDYDRFAAFDLHVLQRKDAEADYDEATRARARKVADALSHRAPPDRRHDTLRRRPRRARPMILGRSPLERRAA